MKYRVLIYDGDIGGYRAVTESVDSFKEAMATCKELQAESDAYYCVQEIPSGTVTADAAIRRK